MTHLPNTAAAHVEEIKIRNYLRNPGHPQNGGKAAYFGAFGFVTEDWIAMRDALVEHAMVNQTAGTLRSPHGTKHLVRCSIVTPDGRSPCITTLWIVEGRWPPRLVTSYP